MGEMGGGKGQQMQKEPWESGETAERTQPRAQIREEGILFHKALSEKRSKPQHKTGRDGAVVLKNCLLS